MRQIGYSLVSASNEELHTYSDIPGCIKLSNGDDVHGAASGDTFDDGSRLIPTMLDDNPPGEWYRRLREERAVYQDQVVVTIVYSDTPDIKDERAHMLCTPFQGRVALSNAGLLSQVEAAINDPTTNQETKIAWEYAIEWKRMSPMIISLATALSLTDEQVDQLFRDAAQIAA